MKTKSVSQSAVFNASLLIGFALCSVCLLPASTALSQSVTGPIAREVPPQRPGTWKMTSSMLTTHLGHTATLLPNGEVLVAGGHIFGGRANAELYDPATRVWTAAGRFTPHREDHTVTLLPNGQVLVAGGSNGFNTLASAELYDPATGLWTKTGRMVNARLVHTAALLPNGKVLVAGGSNGSVSLASAELYDPATGRWTMTGSMATARTEHTGTLLSNGKVLVAGGSNGTAALATAELYDPATGGWTGTGTWSPRETTTPRRSCLTVKCSSLGDRTAPLSRARNAMTLRLGYGRRQAG